MENQEPKSQPTDENAAAPAQDTIPELDHNETDTPAPGNPDYVHDPKDTIVQNGVVESAEVMAPYTGAPEVEPTSVLNPTPETNPEEGHNVTGAALIEPGEGDNDSDLPYAAGEAIPPTDVTPDDIPAGAFGDMVEVEGNSVDLAVRLLCWNLTTSGALGEQSLVYIENDAEALDIAKKWGIQIGVRDDGIFTAGLGFPHIDVLLKDKSARILLCRVVHFCATHSDPPVEKILTSIATAIQDQETNKAKPATE